MPLGAIGRPPRPGEVGGAVSIDGGELPCPHAPDPVLWVTAHRRGITACGPVVRAICAEPDPAWLAAWNRTNLTHCWHPWASRARPRFASLTPSAPPGRSGRLGPSRSRPPALHHRDRRHHQQDCRGRLYGRALPPLGGASDPRPALALGRRRHAVHDGRRPGRLRPRRGRRGERGGHPSPDRGTRRRTTLSTGTTRQAVVDGVTSLAPDRAGEGEIRAASAGPSRWTRCCRRWSRAPDRLSDKGLPVPCGGPRPMARRAPATVAPMVRHPAAVGRDSGPSRPEAKARADLGTPPPHTRVIHGYPPE